MRLETPAETRRAAFIATLRCYVVLTCPPCGLVWEQDAGALLKLVDGIIWSCPRCRASWSAHRGADGVFVLRPPNFGSVHTEIAIEEAGEDDDAES